MGDPTEATFDTETGLEAAEFIRSEAYDLGYVWADWAESYFHALYFSIAGLYTAFMNEGIEFSDRLGRDIIRIILSDFEAKGAVIKESDESIWSTIWNEVKVGFQLHSGEIEAITDVFSAVLFEAPVMLFFDILIPLLFEEVEE